MGQTTGTWPHELGYLALLLNELVYHALSLNELVYHALLLNELVYHALLFSDSLCDYRRRVRRLIKISTGQQQQQKQQRCAAWATRSVQCALVAVP